MIKEIVIAAYDRDLVWMDKINSDVRKVIYIKGRDAEKGEIFLDNVGRDVHTFFYHIYKNYNNLADYMFFSQDYPFDHFENIVEMVNGDVDDWKQNARLIVGGYYGFHYNSIKNPSKNGGIMWNMKNSEQHGIGKVLSCYSNGSPQHKIGEFDVDELWRELFVGEPPVTYEFIPGGHFCVTKEHIKIRSELFYKKIVDILELDINSPWVIERLECYIFNPKFKSKF
jgi:hypothetical protein